MRFHRIALGSVLILGLALVPVGLGGSAGATNPNLGKSSHGHMDNGNALPHVSGGSEVTFDEERAAAADAQSSAGSDLPPDATVSAIGCANRGSMTNPRVNQDCTARRQAEEQVAVNPLDPNNVIAGQNDSRIGFNHCGFDYSLDGGKTFGDGIPPFSQHLSPAGHTYDAASDPNVTFNGAGVAWYSCVVFDINTNASGIFAVPSTVGLKGSAYRNIPAGPSNFVVAETNDGHTFYDKQFMAGDPGGTSVYITFTKFVSDQKCSTGNNPGAYCSSEIFYSKWDKAANAGAGAWSPIANVSGDSSLCIGGNTFDKKASPTACNFNQGSMPVVSPDGSVFVVWNNNNTPTALNQTLGRRINTDGTMSPVVKVGQDDETNIALCDFGRGPEECVKSLNVRTNDFPAIAIDPTNPNHLVAVWQDSRHSAPGAGTYGVVVSDSANGGVTWSDSAGGGTVLDGAAGEALFEPSVAITGTGTTAVSFYRANLHTGVRVGGGTFGYGMRSRHFGLSFGTYLGLSDGQTYPGPQANASQNGFLGDYSSIAAPTTSGSNVVHAVWSDTRNASSAGPDEDVFMRTTVAP